MADKLKGTLTPKANLSGKLYMPEKVVVGGVTSVNGRTGAVTLTASDVGALAESELDTAIDTALAEAKASGDFKGEKGDTGAQGIQGEKGADGYSPTLSTSKADGITTITITDATGTKTATIADGEKGADGSKGADGYSPTAYVSKTGNKSTLVVVDQTGKTQVEILDGEKGETGAEGYTPVKGIDYYTESDKSEIVADATESMKPLIPSVPVQSVNSKTGAVELTASDVGALPDTTESLKNPNSLTIKIGDESVEYDGSEAKTVTIPDGSEVSY